MSIKAPFFSKPKQSLEIRRKNESIQTIAETSPEMVTKPSEDHIYHVPANAVFLPASI